MPIMQALLTRGDTAYLIRGPDGCALGVDCLSLNDLVRLYHQGIRRIATARPAATDCAATKFNSLLASRGLAAIEIDHLTRADRFLCQRLAEDSKGVNTNRRALFTRISAPVAAAAEAQVDDETLLAALLATRSDRPGALFPWVPHIDPARCSGCEACIRACPTDALTLLKDVDGGQVYAIEAEKCTGCGLCISLCDETAIGIREMATRPDNVDLDEVTCRACGVPVRVPRRDTPPEDLCWICRKTDHHKNLHLVLK